jgi:hypothetical protein
MPLVQSFSLENTHQAELPLQGLPPLGRLFCIRDEELSEFFVETDPAFESQRIMKIMPYVLPLVAMIIAAVWLVGLRGSNNALEQNNRSLQKQIAESRLSAASQNERARAGTKSAEAKREEKPSENESKPSADWVSTSRDWNALVLFNNNEGARFNLTEACRRLENLASEMTGDELVRAYKEMASLPVEAEFRDYLESMMLQQLKKKNPEFAFSQYIEKCQNEDTSPIGMGDFNEWLARDPAAATTWYERQLAADVFDKTLDGKSPTMVPFEAAFIMSLLSSDPAAAEQRMKNVSPDLRGSLGAYVWNVPKADSKAFVDLLRKTMQMEEYVAILKNNSLTAYNFSLSNNNDPKSAQTNLESLGFTPEERSTLLAQHFSELAGYCAMRDKGNNPSREKFEEHRKWIQAIDPSSADRATGFALQSYLKKSQTTEAQEFVEKIAMDYHGSGAGDEVLIPLIEASANGSVSFPKDRARVLATKISDDRLREELLQKLN